MVDLVNSVTHIVTPVVYKGFKIKSLCSTYGSFGEDLHCFAIKDSYTEHRRDEHGKLVSFRHDAETFDFTIGYDEFLRETCDPAEVVLIRFKAEVDYYLKHKLDITEDDFIKTTTWNYYCPCCGTNFITSKEGYTPKCENCGALMKLEAFNGVK